MPSPFPGMNPYLDGLDTWPDLRLQLINNFLEQIVSQLRHELICRVRPHPLPQYRSWLEISNLRSDERFTVVELIPGAAIAHRSGIEEYLAVREHVVQSGSNYVGICLQRSANLALNLQALLSEPRRTGTTWTDFEVPACDYCVLEIRANSGNRASLWPIFLHESLPTIPIPLRSNDREASLDIQFALNRAYDAAGFERYIYRDEPEPPLTPEQSAWAKAFIPPRAT